MTVKILAVIVLYKCTPELSVAVQSLRRSLECESLPELKVLIFDNFPLLKTTPSLPDSFIYERSQVNQGLTAAYNRALEIARKENFDWLLTLDQDSNLPGDFLANMIRAVRQFQDDLTVASIVPQLIHDAIPLSPVYVRSFRPFAVSYDFRGFSQRELYALNSAAFLRVSSILELGGFTTNFWLDQLDLWLHHSLHRAGKRVFVEGHVKVEHNLSLLDYRARNTARFQEFLQAESAFFDLYKGPLDNLGLTLRLIFRIWKEKKSGGGPASRRAIYSVLKRRLFQGKTKRIAQWRTTIEKHIGANLRDEDWPTNPIKRPKISVCMSAYNGASFIEEQIRSILPQLDVADELIVVDDFSSDKTIDIIEGLSDPRIRLIRHPANLGVARSFEDAISRASGDVIFLSDQDDIWEPAKVPTIMEAFSDHAEVKVVVSDASLVNDEGLHLAGSYFALRGAFHDGFLSNLLKGKYLGCVMAFRATLLPEILPFPTGFDVLHDIWIGSRNRLSGGKTLFIDKPLVRYRRHLLNVTGNSKLSRFRQLRTRVDLVTALVLFSFRKRKAWNK